MRGSTLARWAALWLVLCTARAHGAPTEISGMARMPEDRTYLVVHDTKTGKEPPWSTRIGVLRFSAAGEAVYQPLCITDWGASEELPNDLESCCPIPGRASEYLVAESGYYEGRFGRIFHLRVSRLPGSALYHGEVLGRFCPEARPEPGFSTPGADQLEGMTCFAREAELVLVLGRRGGAGKPGGLVWGRLDLDRHRFEGLGRAELTLDPPQMRACGDLYLESSDPPTLLCVATSDPGDLGPFRSWIYQAGSFRAGPDGWHFEPAPFVPLWTLDGSKVEALSSCSLPGSPLCVGTDDEVYGGIWRPLPGR